MCFQNFNRLTYRKETFGEDNIRMDLEEIGINGGIGLIRLRIGIIGEPL